MAETFKTSDGLQVAWHELGAGSDLPPIVLQHGISTQTHDEWVACGIAEKLAALGRRLIGIDARGHGGSDNPYESHFYGEARMALDVTELVTQLGYPAYDLVSYSMGGVIATLVATRDRRVRRLVIGGVGEAMVLLGGVDTRMLDNKLLVDVMRADDPSGYPEFLRGFRENALARGNDRLALAAAAAVAHQGSIDFGAITAKTLVIAGDADPLALNPALLADAIPGARLAIVPGDHTGARLAPEFTATLVAFLS